VSENKEHKRIRSLTEKDENKGSDDGDGHEGKKQKPQALMEETREGFGGQRLN